MINLVISIFILILGLLGIGAVLQINTMLLIRQIQAFESNRDPAEVFKLSSYPNWMLDKKMDDDLGSRG